MPIGSVTSTELFVATGEAAAQVLRVGLDAGSPAGTVDATAAGRLIGAAAHPGGAGTVEVPLTGLTGRAVGERVPVVVTLAGEHAAGEVVVAEPGWTVWMIPHFHYDPVWWNTQAAYTATWDDLGEAAQRTRIAFQQTGFALVAGHLAAARRDPDYKFVLAEVDYLKPYWDAHPQDRGYLRRLLAEGRVEIMGGTYNEPNTNLTTAETTARNFVHGFGFQRAVLGGDPRTAWQLDVFGHDPQFPGMAAEAGLTSSSWARGPFHQWGPMLWTHEPRDGWGDPSVMQFPAEFEWISPSGRGVLTHYMPAHYSAGWQIDSRTTLEDAEQAVYELFTLLKRVAATRNVLLPVGTDYTPPSKWVTEIQRDWNARYASPRLMCALPKEFFGAVQRQLDAERRQPVPQTRDMNPVYTGKDVSYIDTKQAQRRAESLLVDAEKFATLAALHGAQFPHEAIDKAWRQLVYGAHHDAITGSESDQVYLDLLTTWREAHDIGRDVLAAATDHLAAQVAPSGGADITVFNPSSWDRADLVTVHARFTTAGARSVEVIGPDGQPVPCLVTDPNYLDGELVAADVTFVARAVPGIGYRGGWQVRPSLRERELGWTAEPGATAIASPAYRVAVDPRRGGCVTELADVGSGRSLLRAGEVGNELVVEQEYPEHPHFHEGPWHLVPTGAAVGSAAAPATGVTVVRSPLGSRIVVHGTVSGIDYEQRITLWDELDRIDCSTSLDGFAGADQLVRVRWPVEVPGALPVSEVGNAVVGRGFALLGVDSAEHPWTLDNPAQSWFALSSTARVRIATDERAAPWQRAIGIAEIIAPGPDAAPALRELAVALAGQGVTATTSTGGGTRYGRLAVDSNLPDVRIAIGGPEQNAFTAAVLAAADEQYRRELDRQRDATGSARVWVPAARALQQVWQPSADLSGARDLPVLVVIGADEVAALCADLDDAVIEVVQAADPATPGERSLDDYTVGLLNTGLPGFAVDPRGTLHLSLLRSCTGWPSGVWIDPPRRTAPDGSNFQQQHWTHTFDYALAAGPGDWRHRGLVRAGHDLNHPLHVSRTPNVGPLPSADRMVAVRSDGDVVVTALKPRGNPIADGRRPGPLDALTLRVYEASGRRAHLSVTTSCELAAAARLDLLEQEVERCEVDAGATSCEWAMDPMQIATLGLELRQPARGATAELIAASEPHQPVFSRYWLNNTGPAPRGNVPVAVHVEPPLTEWASGDRAVPLTVRLASDLTERTVSGSAAVLVPDGWSASLASVDYTLEPGGHRADQLEVLPPPDLAPGTYRIRVRAEVDGQHYEDVARVVTASADVAELAVELSTPEIRLAPGQHAQIAVVLSSTARSEVSAQVQLISPWHTWQLLPQWNTGCTLAPGEVRTLRFPVKLARSARPGEWWALIKVASAGLLHYTEPVRLSVRPR